MVSISVPDPDLNPDPHVYGLPDTDPDPLVRGVDLDLDPSIILHHQAKIIRKTLIFNVLCLLLDFLSSKNDVNVPLKSNKQKLY